ncbi:MAG: aminotransferase class V-fold PLP-dependent enzyme [Planctomycetota bacterium]
MPARARRAVAHAAGAVELGRVVRGDQAAAVEVARGALATLLGWDPAGLAFTTNTTTAVALLAQGTRWSAGDRVVLHEDETPGNLLPWEALRSRGVELEVLPSREGRLDLQDLERACRARPPRWVSLAAIALGTGDRRDVGAIRAICAEVGARLCVDVAQAAGALDLRRELQGIDAIVGCGRKWLCGPPEAGFLGVRPGALAELDVITAGGASRLPDGSWVEGARRLEGGVLPILPLVGLAESVSLVLELGPAAVEARILELAAALRQLGLAAGWELRSPGGQSTWDHSAGDRGVSGIVHFELPCEVPGLEAALEARGVVVRVQGRRLRASPHAWTAEAELERLVREVAALGGC